MNERRVLRVDANSTLEEVSAHGSKRAIRDGSTVALVYEAENVRGERALVFESTTRTVRVATYPTTWRESTELDLLALWQRARLRPRDEGREETRVQP